MERSKQLQNVRKWPFWGQNLTHKQPPCAKNKRCTPKNYMLDRAFEHFSFIYNLSNPGWNPCSGFFFLNINRFKFCFKIWTIIYWKCLFQSIIVVPILILGLESCKIWQRISQLRQLTCKEKKIIVEGVQMGGYTSFEIIHSNCTCSNKFTTYLTHKYFTWHNL